MLKLSYALAQQQLQGDAKQGRAAMHSLLVEMTPSEMFNHLDERKDGVLTVHDLAHGLQRIYGPDKVVLEDGLGDSCSSSEANSPGPGPLPSFAKSLATAVGQPVIGFGGRRLSRIDEKIDNISRRYPEKSRGEVEAALVLNDGHAGNACQDLREGCASLISGLPNYSSVPTDGRDHFKVVGALGDDSENTECPMDSGSGSDDPLSQVSPLSPVCSRSEKVVNLMKRFPFKTQAEIESALERCDGHAGQVSILFNKEAARSPTGPRSPTRR